MSTSATSTDYGKTTQTSYQRQQQEKADAAGGKVSHTDFLKLLTTQLTNQDPLNPMEDIDFTGQLAQLQALDEQMAMTKTMQSMRYDTQLQAGTAMIGKFVSGTDKNGASANGLVVRVEQNSDGVFVELANKQKVEVGSINNVWNDANSMNNDIASSLGAIDKWVEAGYDEAGQPIRGIVEKVNVVNGQVVLTLYGGKSVTWSQVSELRDPTEDELWYVLPDELREKAEKAAKTVNKGVTAKDDDGNLVSGIVGGIERKGEKIYLLIYNGDKDPIAVDYDKLEGDARKPTAEDAAKSLGGLWVTGLAKDGGTLSGIVVGAEQNDDGMALILDSGERVYFDTIEEIREGKDEEKARLHGMWVEGEDTGGDDVGGIVVKKVEVDGKLALELHNGKVIICEKVTEVRKPTDEEQAAWDEQKAQQG